MDPSQLPLRDVHPPDAIGLWPLGPGWWLVIAIVLVLGIVALRRAVYDYRQGAARRLALSQLKAFKDDYERHRSPVRFAADVSALLRRAMLAYSPREAVAGLTGPAWLEWLDRDLASPCFQGDVGRALLELPYRDPDAGHSNSDVERLYEAVRMRLVTPIGDSD